MTKKAGARPGQAKAWKQEFLPSLPCEWQGPNTWTICCCFSQAIGMELDWNQSIQNTNRYSHGMSVSQVANLSSVLQYHAPSDVCYTKCLPPKESFIQSVHFKAQNVMLCSGADPQCFCLLHKMRYDI